MDVDTDCDIDDDEDGGSHLVVNLDNYVHLGKLSTKDL